MTTDRRPFQIGDNVNAAYRMAGCKRQWIEARGTITSIWGAIDDSTPVPGLVLVSFDNPVPVPCDNQDHAHEPYTGLAISINDDCTAPVYDHNRLDLIQENVTND